MIKFKALHKMVENGQHKNMNPTQRWEAHEAIRRKEEIMETERQHLARKVFNRFLMNSGKGTKYQEHATESVETKGRVWMQRILHGKFSKGTEATWRERDRLELVRKAFGLATLTGHFNGGKDGNDAGK